MKILTTNLLLDTLDEYLFEKYNIRLTPNVMIVFGINTITIVFDISRVTINYNKLIKYYVENQTTRTDK